MMIAPALSETLALVAQAAERAKDAWWIIGSAAVALHGGDVPEVKDVDLMMSARDAEQFIRGVSARAGGAEPSDRFASDVFGLWTQPPIPVEIFGGFRIADGPGWREISFASREAAPIEGGAVYIPSKAELLDLLHAFGRPKDIERAALLC